MKCLDLDGMRMQVRQQHAQWSVLGGWPGPTLNPIDPAQMLARIG